MDLVSAFRLQMTNAIVDGTLPLVLLAVGLSENGAFKLQDFINLTALCFPLASLVKG